MNTQMKAVEQYSVLSVMHNVQLKIDIIPNEYVLLVL